MTEEWKKKTKKTRKKKITKISRASNLNHTNKGKTAVKSTRWKPPRANIKQSASTSNRKHWGLPLYFVRTPRKIRILAWFFTLSHHWRSKSCARFYRCWIWLEGAINFIIINIKAIRLFPFRLACAGRFVRIFLFSFLSFGNFLGTQLDVWLPEKQCEEINLLLWVR